VLLTFWGARSAAAHETFEPNSAFGSRAKRRGGGGPPEPFSRTAFQRGIPISFRQKIFDEIGFGGFQNRKRTLLEFG
jgi:hypothetical protein